VLSVSFSLPIGATGKVSPKYIIGAASSLQRIAYYSGHRLLCFTEHKQKYILSRWWLNEKIKDYSSPQVWDHYPIFATFLTPYL
jgi:hypothetical protein